MISSTFSGFRITASLFMLLDFLFGFSEYVTSNGNVILSLTITVVNRRVLEKDYDLYSSPISPPQKLHYIVAPKPFRDLYASVKDPFLCPQFWQPYPADKLLFGCVYYCTCHIQNVLNVGGL